jgi:hypothetical protein
MPGLSVNAATEALLYDRAAALMFYLPQFLLHATPRASQVDPDHAIPVFAGGVGDRSDSGHDPGVVERGVESAELGDGAVHHRGQLGVAHITTDGECLVTGGDELLLRRLHRVFFEVRQNEGRACLRERLRRR